MPNTGRIAETRWLDLVTKISITLLLISAFRVPAALPALAPVVVWIKAGIRFGVLLGVGLALIQNWRVMLDRRILPWFAPLFIFCGWEITSTFWSPLKSESLGQAISLTTMVLLSLAISVSQRDERDTERLLRWTMLNLWVISLILLLLGVLIPSTDYLTREGLGLGHSTNAGATASLALVALLLFHLLWTDQKTDFSWFFYGCVFIPVALIAANRMSMVIAALLVPMIIVLYGGRRWIATTLIGIACIGTLYPIADPKFKSFAKVSESFNRGQSTEEIGSLSGRQAMWEVIWDSYLDSPLIGHGFFVSSAKGELVVWYSDDELLPVNWTAHNVWLQALVSTGLIGLILFIAGVTPPFLWIAAKRLWGYRWTMTDKFAGMLVVWYFMWSLLNESILGPVQPECVVFFVIFGALIANHSRQLAPETRSQRYDTAPIAGGRFPELNQGALQP